MFIPAHVCCRLTVHQVTGLSPGKEYQFRVFAENLYGKSEPSEPTKPINTEQVSERRRGKDGELTVRLDMTLSRLEINILTSDAQQNGGKACYLNRCKCRLPVILKRFSLLIGPNEVVNYGVT